MTKTVYFFPAFRLSHCGLVTPKQTNSQGNRNPFDSVD